MNFIAYSLSLLAVVLLLPTTVLLTQVLAALLPDRSEAGDDTSLPNKLKQKPSICVLMPAHNEAAGIGQALAELVPKMGQSTRLLVVADNCTDQTANIVRAAATMDGRVSVIERTNATQRGKGFALDFGVRHLASQAPDVVVVLDADCAVSKGAIEILACQCTASSRPVQALYLMLSPTNAADKTRLAEFAWLVKNKVRALGYYRLGLPCQLMGSGMAFSWAQISKLELGTDQIVEDLQMGLDMASNRTPALFCPAALVTSYFPSSTDGLLAQRTRWEHGHLGVMVSQLPKLLVGAVTNLNVPLLALTFDLCVPPLALLTFLSIALVCGAVPFALIGGPLIPAILATACAAMLILAIVVAWVSFGSHVISFRQMCQVPGYAISKLPLYLKFLVKKEVTWVRAKRDNE